MKSVKVVKRVPFEVIADLKLKPEPHTVILNKDKPGGIWWVLCDEHDCILSIVCVVCRKNEVHFARTFTPVEYRNNGYATALIGYLSKHVYPNDKLTAHCLPASVSCYTIAGFQCVAIKEFKHGVQYYMRRDEREHDCK